MEGFKKFAAVLGFGGIFFLGLAGVVSADYCAGEVYKGKAQCNDCPPDQQQLCGPSDIWYCIDQSFVRDCSGYTTKSTCEATGNRPSSTATCGGDAICSGCSWHVGTAPPGSGSWVKTYLACSDLVVSGTKDASGNLLVNKTYSITANFYGSNTNGTKYKYHIRMRARSGDINVCGGSQQAFNLLPNPAQWIGGYELKPPTQDDPMYELSYPGEYVNANEAVNHQRDNEGETWTRIPNLPFSWTPKTAGTYKIYCGVQYEGFDECSWDNVCDHINLTGQCYPDWPGYKIVTVASPPQSTCSTTINPPSACAGSTTVSYTGTVSSAATSPPARMRGLKLTWRPDIVPSKTRGLGDTFSRQGRCPPT